MGGPWAGVYGERSIGGSVGRGRWGGLMGGGPRADLWEGVCEGVHEGVMGRSMGEVMGGVHGGWGSMGRRGLWGGGPWVGSVEGGSWERVHERVHEEIQ